MKCKKCGKEFTGKYSKWSSGDFCSRSCANSYSRSFSKESKIVKCLICGREIEVGRRAPQKNCLCKECKYNKKNKKCKYCGEYICKRKDICKKYRIFPTLIKYFGMDESKFGSVDIYKEYERIKNIIEEEYVINKKSSVELGETYNFNYVRNFNKILNILDIKMRNLSDATKNAWFFGKLENKEKYNQYKCGWHITWNNKKVFYRSSYELDYCKELDEKKIDYEMETLRFWYWDSQKQKQRVAIPDFYIPSENMIVEIKSDWTYDEQNMNDKIKEYKQHGYKVKLILEHKELF